MGLERVKPDLMTEKQQFSRACFSQQHEDNSTYIIRLWEGFSDTKRPLKHVLYCLAHSWCSKMVAFIGTAMMKND